MKFKNNFFTSALWTSFSFTEEFLFKRVISIWVSAYSFSLLSHLFIFSQVPTHLIGTDAFQECDTTGITRPCTIHNWLVKDIKDLSKILHQAFRVATTGRPGPVLVDIPKDIQFAKGKYINPKELKSNKHLNIK